VDARKIGFDGWVLDPDSGDLERPGARVRLQEQPLQVLLELIDARGGVVTREQLIAKLWPKGVVDFDTGLNTAIRKLRVALGDTADTPRYIETLPRRGYRFVAALDAPPQPPSPQPTPSLAPAPQQPLSPGDAPAVPGGESPASAPGAAPAPHTFPTTRAPFRLSRLVMSVVLVLALVFVYFLVDKFWLPRRVSAGQHVTDATTTFSDKSIAVLPFIDMSEKKDQEYFADGLSEELIDMLTQVPELRVPARTSSFYFKGKQATIADIAKALGVTHVLEGSVRKSGDTLRITAQLIRVDTGYHVWSETYDRKLDDIFQIQDEIAKSVVNGLKVSVLGGTMPRATPTANHDAYMLYLQAKEMNYRGTSDSSRKATEYLRKALELDPNFSQGWLTLASFLAADYNLFDPVPHDEIRELIYSALDHARKLEPGHLPIHMVMGRVLYEVDFNWQAADAELKQAIALEPGNAEAHRLAGYLATTYGRFDEAVEQSEKAIELDPLQPWNYIGRGYAAYRSGRLAQAEVDYRTALDLAPQSGKFHCLLGAVLITRGQRESALAEMEKEPSPRFHQVGVALALEMLGRRNESDKELRTAEQEFGDEMGYWIAIVYAARRDPDRAFAWLERALHVYGEGITWIKGDPLLGSLVGDPRYKALLQEMKLPE
jgi:TolB-like protein/DNA-binding winged helix-turn-helix (wHTH) protein/tetratricopeptide (TPR) repeat protein